MSKITKNSKTLETNEDEDKYEYSSITENSEINQEDNESYYYSYEHSDDEALPNRSTSTPTNYDKFEQSNEAAMMKEYGQLYNSDYLRRLAKEEAGLILKEENIEESDSEAMKLLDDSETDSEEEFENRIGNINVNKKYEADSNIIGYDINGNPVQRSISAAGGELTGARLDKLVQRMEAPTKFFRTVYDKNTDSEKLISRDDFAAIRRVAKGGTASGINVRENLTARDADRNRELFNNVITQTNISKKHLTRAGEKKAIKKIGRSIDNGSLDPNDIHRLRRKKHLEDQSKNRDIWDENDIEETKTTIRHIPPPKIILPGHGESYNPPDEFIGSPLGKIKAKKYNSLRDVPAYENFVMERFQRCLDLYLAPRAYRQYEKTDPSKLLPDLPDKKELGVFPQMCDITMRGHRGKVLSVCFSPCGMFIASGGTDGTVRIWETSSGRMVRTIPIVSVKRLSEINNYFKTAVTSVAWCPKKDISVVIAAVGKEVVILDPGVASSQIRKNTRALLNFDPESVETVPHVQWETPEGIVSCEGNYENQLGMKVEGPTDADSEADEEENLVRRFEQDTYQQKIYEKTANGINVNGPNSEEKQTNNIELETDNKETEKNKDTFLGLDDNVYEPYGKFTKHILVRIHHPYRVNSLDWHAKGDYFLACSPGVESRAAVTMHQLSKHRSQNPFKKYKGGRIVISFFHPSKPSLIAVTDHSTRVYNLKSNTLESRLFPGLTNVVAAGVGNCGDLAIAGQTARVSIYIGTSGPQPDAKVRFHTTPITSLAIHKNTGLLATAADDGLIQILRVSSKLKSVKKAAPCINLKGHKITEGGTAGVKSVAWHPMLPWLASGGADGTIKLWK